MKYLKNESGLSLIELLATLVITAMIGMIAYAILFNGFKTYERIKTEAELRDEADLIMAQMISEFFTLKESEMKTVFLPQNSTNNYYIELDNGAKIGFINGKLFLKDEATNVLQSGLINMTDKSKIVEESKGQYRIILELEWSNNNQTLMTESEVKIINDED